MDDAELRRRSEELAREYEESIGTSERRTLTQWLRGRTEGPRNAWTWPLVALCTLVGIVLVGTILALMLGGCAAGRSTQGTSDGDSGISTQTSTQGMEERKVTLSDGRVITCITWVDTGYQYENTAAGISCDWGAPVDATDG